MKKWPHLFVLIVVLLSTFMSHSQNYIKTEYIGTSRYVNNLGEKSNYRGDMVKTQANILLPLSFKKDADSLITMWAVNINETYATLDNHGLSYELAPKSILNTSLSAVYITPLSHKWSVFSSLGVGIYAAPDNVTLKSILVNGGVLFIRKMKESLSLGAGLGVTNAYGAPMAIPMFYLDWKTQGKYEIKVAIGGLSTEVSAMAKLNNKLNLRLVAVEMDGMASVMEVEGKSMIFGMNTVKSLIKPEYLITKSAILSLGIGAVWDRSATLNERTLKSLFDSFGDESIAHFNPAFVANIALSYNF